MSELPPRFYYSTAYDLSWEGHVFPAGKYRALRDRLEAEGHVAASDFGVAEPLDRQSLLLGHDAHYLDRLEAMTADPEQGFLEFEAPCSRQVLDGFYTMAGGTLAACRSALAHRGRGPFAANLGGGFHHAFPWKGEGFCAINDVVVALAVLLDDRSIARAAVVDLDVHQGNGTARAFEREPRVFTCSLHQENNYPVKARSDLDVGLPDRVEDEAYLDALGTALETVAATEPELVLYVAGADPYRGDQLGGLCLTIEGLAARDRAVFDATLSRDVPVAAVLAGGYAASEAEVVEIHDNMCVEGLRRAEEANRREESRGESR